MRNARPRDVTVLVVLQIIAGVVGITFGLLILQDMLRTFALYGDSDRNTWFSWNIINCTIMKIIGGIEVLMGIIQFVITYGYLKAKTWSWILGLGFAVFGIITDIIWAYLIIVDLISNLSIIILLIRPSVKQFLDKDPQQIRKNEKIISNIREKNQKPSISG